MPTLAIVSSDVKDLYYQEVEQDSDFFTQEHFDRMVAMEYGNLIQQYYERNYAQNRQETGQGTVDISQDWLLSEQKEIEKDTVQGDYFVTLGNKPFSFLYDQQTSAIQNIIPIKGNTCGEFKRTSIKELFKLKLLPTTKIVWWYYDMCGNVRFVDMKCKPEAVMVYYLPSMGDEPCADFLIPDGLASQISRNVLQLMLGVKNGNVVDMTNDGNSNRTLQTEINQSSIKP